MNVVVSQHVQSGSLPVPPSHAVNSHQPALSGVIDGNTNRNSSRQDVKESRVSKQSVRPVRLDAGLVSQLGMTVQAAGCPFRSVERISRMFCSKIRRLL